MIQNKNSFLRLNLSIRPLAITVANNLERDGHNPIVIIPAARPDDFIDTVSYRFMENGALVEKHDLVKKAFKEADDQFPMQGKKVEFSGDTITMKSGKKEAVKVEKVVKADKNTVDELPE